MAISTHDSGGWACWAGRVGNAVHRHPAPCSTLQVACDGLSAGASCASRVLRLIVGAAMAWRPVRARRVVRRPRRGDAGHAPQRRQSGGAAVHGRRRDDCRSDAPRPDARAALRAGGSASRGPCCSYPGCTHRASTSRGCPARAAARRERLAVVTPDIPELSQYRDRAAITDAIEDAVSWLARRHDARARRPHRLMGISFSGGLSVVAAGRPSLADASRTCSRSAATTICRAC